MYSGIILERLQSHSDNGFSKSEEKSVRLGKQSGNSIAGHNAKCIRDSILSGCTHRLIFKVRINWPIFDSAFFDSECYFKECTLSKFSL